MNIQWYPGHMTKAKRMMQENIKLVELILELVDARVPWGSRNPDIDEMGRQKARIILLNKCDLADEKKTALWRACFKEQGFQVVMVNSRSGAGLKAIQGAVQEACREKIERDRKRGILNRPIRAMVAGIPNVGKSTFINKYVGKATAKTGDKPGVTRGKQWIKLKKDFELLDTPGILWPKFENQAVGLKLALIGSMKDEILNVDELALELINYLRKEYPGALSERYQADETVEASAILEDIAEKRKCLKKGGGLDYSKAAALALEEFRNGKIGRLTIELPEE